MVFREIIIAVIVAAFLPLSAIADGTDRYDNYTAGTSAGANLEIDGSGARATNNTFIGAYAGNADTTGSANIGIGYGALRGLTTGRGNVAIGMLAGQSATTGNHDLFINSGYYPDYGIFGSFDTGYFGINNTSPAVALDVTGAITASGVITGVGVSTGGGALTNYIRTVHSIDADSTLTAADSGDLFEAMTIGQKTSYTLPTAAAGLIFRFAVDDTDTLRVLLGASDKIIDISAEHTTAYTSVAGALVLEALDNEIWYVMSSSGTWTGY